MRRDYDSMFSEFAIERPVSFTIVGLAVLAAVTVAGAVLVAMHSQRSGSE